MTDTLNRRYEAAENTYGEPISRAVDAADAAVDLEAAEAMYLEMLRTVGADAGWKSQRIVFAALGRQSNED